MLLLKNPQFLPNQDETLSIWGTREYLILTKFRNNWVKIVDFEIMTYFWARLRYVRSHFMPVQNYNETGNV